MRILMDTTQIKWDYVVIGNYKVRNYPIIAYLPSCLMNVKNKKQKPYRKKNVTSSHTKTTNRIITPVFKQKYFSLHQNKMKALIYLIYLTDSSGVLIYRVPSVKIQYSKRVLQ